MRDHEQGISKSDLDRLRSLIYTKSGITLGPDKKTMLELRLKPRLKSLELDSYDDYCTYLFDPSEQTEELVHLLDAITTNKTDFFREPGHFDYLVRKALPETLARTQSNRPLLAWSAGCSTGEEPYTLAMVLEEYGLTRSGFRFRIMATDLSTSVLEKAERAIFKSTILDPVPTELRRKYFMRSRDPDSDQMRVVPELRRHVEFRRLNFMDKDYGLSEKVDFLFCRNVIIYFDRSTQEQILRKLASNLVPGGYAFLGHSETVHGLDVPLEPVAPALYRKPYAQL